MIWGQNRQGRRIIRRVCEDVNHSSELPCPPFDTVLNSLINREYPGFGQIFEPTKIPDKCALPACQVTRTCSVQVVKGLSVFLLSFLENPQRE